MKPNLNVENEALKIIMAEMKKVLDVATKGKTAPMIKEFGSALEIDLITLILSNEHKL